MSFTTDSLRGFVSGLFAEYMSLVIFEIKSQKESWNNRHMTKLKMPGGEGPEA